MNKFSWPKIDLNEEFPPLTNAPIIEAVIYWQADVSRKFEQAQLANLLSERLPSYGNSQPLFVQSIETSGIGGSTSRFSKETLWTGFRLEAPQNHYVAQFHRNGVVFSRLAPYQEWASFLTESMVFWQIFQDITQPTALQRLGVRYINQIPLSGDEQPSTYLQALQPSLPGLTLSSESFFYQDIYKFPGSPYTLNWVRTLQPQVSTSQDEVALILDIDVFTGTIIDLAEENLITCLREMRWLKNKTFFECITPTARERFSA